MKVTIHQPEHMPWLGYFDKMSQADKFVILDNVQYRKNYFQNRNRILTENGSVWITVPIKKQPYSTLIKDTIIQYNHDWTKKYLRSIEANYLKARYLEKYYPDIRSIILDNNESLSLLNVSLIRRLASFLEIETKIIIASEIVQKKVSGGTEVNLEICKTLGATTYLSGPIGKDYLDQTRFQEAGIEVMFHKFKHPEYKQIFEPFTPNMSCIDLLFNHGTKARTILFPPK